MRPVSRGNCGRPEATSRDFPELLSTTCGEGRHGPSRGDDVRDPIIHHLSDGRFPRILAKPLSPFCSACVELLLAFTLLWLGRSEDQTASRPYSRDDKTSGRYQNITR